MMDYMLISVGNFIPPPSRPIRKLQTNNPFEVFIKHTNDPKTYFNMALLSKGFHNICEDMKLDKMNQFMKDGKLPNGNKHGRYEEATEDRLIAFCHYVNGKLHGNYKEYYKINTLKIFANYRNGKLHGEYRRYYPNGNPQMQCDYVDGNRHGLFYSWREDGIFLEECHYVHGILL